MMPRRPQLYHIAPAKVRIATHEQCQGFSLRGPLWRGTKPHREFLGAERHKRFGAYGKIGK